MFNYLDDYNGVKSLLSFRYDPIIKEPFSLFQSICHAAISRQEKYLRKPGK